jgi:hypothetical protein
MDTMKTLRIIALGLAAALLTSVVVADGTVKSGPQKGEDLAGPFHPLNINGSKAGEKNCLYCSNGSNPVAMVFAREVTPAVKELITKLDSCAAKHTDVKMGSFFVFCSDDEGLADKLKTVAKDADLKKVVLSIDNPAGPKGYMVNKGADVTIVLYKDRNVKANFAYKKGEFTQKEVETVLKAIPSITKE